MLIEPSTYTSPSPAPIRPLTKYSGLDLRIKPSIVRGEMSTKEEQVLELLTNVGPLTARRIAESLPGHEIHYRTLNRILRLLVSKGHIQRLPGANRAYVYSVARAPATINLGHRLPNDVENFVGRQQEIRWLTHKIPQSRCVGVYGPSGIGKSSLVTHVLGTKHLALLD